MPGSIIQQQINELYRVINASKLISELDAISQISDAGYSVAISRPNENARRVNIGSLRGFRGDWDASTNQPPLANGLGIAGDWYKVTMDGIVNLGSGLIAFKSGDLIRYDGSNYYCQKTSQNNRILAENEFITTKRGNLNNTTPEIGDRVWFKRVVDIEGNVLTLMGNKILNLADLDVYENYEPEGYELNELP